MSTTILSFSAAARAELNARKGDWPAICRELDLSYWWVTKFAQGRIPEAGVTKVEKLHDYFAAHPRTEHPGQPSGAA